MTATYTPLATTTLGTAASSITFGSIPGTYRDLILVVQATRNTQGRMNIRFNGDTGANYALTGINESTITGETSAQFRGVVVDTSVSFMAVSNIMDYSTTDKEKLMISKVDNAGTANSNGVSVHRWANTSAITSVQVTTTDANTFSIGTTMALYGITS